MELWDRLEKEEVVGKCSVKRCSWKLHKIHRKNLCWSLFLNKVAGLRPGSLLKKRLQHRCFPLNLVKFFNNSFFKNISAGCFCTKGLFLPIFSKEKSFKQIFFRLTGWTSSNISFYMTKHKVLLSKKYSLMWIFNWYLLQLIYSRRTDLIST